MKKALLSWLCVLCVSCNGNMDPWGNNPNGWNGQGQNQNQNSNPPEETNPTASGVSIEAEDKSEDNVNNTQFEGVVSVTFTANDATISGSVEGVSITKEGTRVTATNTGDKKVKYVLSGQCSDGCFKLYSDKKQAVELSDLSLANTKGAAINNQSKKRTFIVIKGTNTVSDGNVNASGEYDEQISGEDMKAAIFSEGQLAFSGTGTLAVNAIGKAGITSDDYVHFMTGSNVSVTSKNGHGIRGKDAIIVSGGTVNITLESTATGKKCFSTDSLMYIRGGKINLVNNASAGTIDSELTGASGIKADKMFVIQGGELSITASGKGCKCISGDKDGYFEGGSVIANATGTKYGKSSKAIKFDGNLEFSGSKVIASATYAEVIESKGAIYISGGSVSATSKSDDAINSASTMTISDGVVYACSTGNDGLDANGNMIIKGGTVVASGCGNPEVALDANTEKGYRLYIQGGNVVAIGGIESNSSVSVPVISTSWSRNTMYSLCIGDNALFSFQTPSSGGTGLYIFSSSITSGTSYSLKTSATISGASQYCEGAISVGGTATGGSTSSVKAGTYSSGGSFNPGGGGRPGGW